jgi:hypothetical protein
MFLLNRREEISAAISFVRRRETERRSSVGGMWEKIFRCCFENDRYCVFAGDGWFMVETSLFTRDFCCGNKVLALLLHWLVAPPRN